MRLDEVFFDMGMVRAVPSRAHKLLISRGWQPTTTPREYRHPEAPGYSIDIDMHSPTGNGPFALFYRDRKLAQIAYPPYANHLMAGQYVRQHRAA
jgi:hypothetical protein